MLRSTPGLAVALLLAGASVQTAEAEWCCAPRTANYCCPVISPANYAPRIPSYGVAGYGQGLPCSPQQAGPLVPVPVYQGYATPQAAPAPQTREPPTGKPPTSKEPPTAKTISSKEPPRVIESRSFSLSDGGGKGAGAVSKCQVGFWNVTSGNVTLFVDGQRHTVPRNGAIRLSLERQFVWRTESGEVHMENVQDGNEYEVVVRN